MLKHEDVIEAAVFIIWHGIMSGIKEQFCDLVIRQKTFHSKKSMKKTMGVMFGGTG